MTTTAPGSGCGPRWSRPTPRAAVALNLELAAHASLRGDPLEMRACAREALAGAVDPVPAAAATAALAMAAYTLGEYAEARSLGREATAAIAALDDEQLGTRLEMLLFVGWAQFFLGEFESALAHFARGTAIARRAGSAVLALELAVGEALGLLARGRITEALDVADAAVEDARPLGSAQSLVWTLYAQATVLEAGGDPAAAVRAGEEAVALTAGLEPSTITAACGSALAAALVATGEGARAATVLLEQQGGPDLPRFFAGQRAGCYEVLTRAALLTGDTPGAAAWAARAEAARGARRSPSRSRCGRARSVLSTGGDATRAVALALESVATTDRSGSPSSPRAGASSPGARWPRSATATPRPSSCAPPKGCSSTRPPGTCGRRRCVSCAGSAAASTGRAGPGAWTPPAPRRSPRASSRSPSSSRAG